MSMRYLALGVAMVLLMCGLALAHDVWFIKGDGAFVLAYGHGNELEKYDTKKVKEIKALSKNGEAVAIKIVEGDGEIKVIPSDASKELAILTASFDNGYWVKTPEGWKNLSKVEYGKPVEDSSHPLKYTKLILSWSESTFKPVGLEFEIVPLSQPSKGKDLEVQVLYKGKPLAEATVEVMGVDKTFKTDQSGKAIISELKEGYNVIVASYKIPLEDKTYADKLSLSSTLTFELK